MVNPTNRWSRVAGLVAVVSIMAAGAACTKKANDREIRGVLADRPAGTYAYFETNQGDFLVRLFTERAPKTTGNFIGLAEGTKPYTHPKSKKQVTRRFYDGLLFHQVINTQFIATGDPTGVGHAGPGYELELESHPELSHSKAGILAMTNGSQFMIILSPQSGFDGDHQVFGEVVWGMDAVTNIAELPTHFQNRPIRDAVLRRVTIHRWKPSGGGS